MRTPTARSPPPPGRSSSTPHYRQDRIVLEVKTAQERLPVPVHVVGGGPGARAPQPHRLGIAVPGQVINLQPDQGAVDDGQLAVVAEPGGAVGQPRVQPVPGGGAGGTVPPGPPAGADLPAAPRPP